MLCCKVQQKRWQARQELGGFTGQAPEGLDWICHNPLQIQIGSFKASTSMRGSVIFSNILYSWKLGMGVGL